MQQKLWFGLLFAASAVMGASGVPNIIILIADDLGIGDLETYGNTDQGHTEIDRMADEGMKFTHWTAGGFKCTPSRTALLTGRYPFRTGVYGNDSDVFAPNSKGGLPSTEVTIAEGLQAQGYTTGFVGKWHLGINQASRTDGVHLPHNHGFDWVGTNLPHGQSRKCDPNTYTVAEMEGNCFLYNGSSVVEQPIDVANLTQKLLDDALTFINANKAGPFFLYFAFPQVHNAQFCAHEFCGSSANRGEFGDSINEMAWVVGEILDELEDLDIDENTLAIFTSDQGATASNCQTDTEKSFTNGVFRDGKGSTWEGAYRVPTIAWWPETITAGSTSDNLVNHMDLFRTSIHLGGGSTYLANLESSGVYIDGELIPDLVSGATGRDSVFYYCSDRIFAVRYDHYKVHYFTAGPVATSGCKPFRGDWSCYGGTDLVEHDPPVVFDLNKADGETEEVAKDSALQATIDIVDIVNQLVQNHAATITSTATSQLDLGGSMNLVPCCNHPTTCECNYGDGM